MTREVSRRLSYDPVLKGAVRPDRVGERDLNEKIVEDRRSFHQGKIIQHLTLGTDGEIKRQAIAQDQYLRNLTPTDGPSRTTGYKDNNDGGENAKRK